MLEEINAALQTYHRQWHKLVADRKDKTFFENLLPTAVGWKVADFSEYSKVLAELHDDCDKIVETWMNGRWIAKLHLRDKTVDGDIEIIKLMQRRPGSDDALGLDHVDFYSKAVTGAASILEKEPELKWTHETNDAVDNYGWLSVWFADTEAKLKDETVLDIVTKELQAINQKIIKAD